MKRLLTLLVIVAFAVWAALAIAQDPGYMLLAYRHWTLETPLWFGIILWLIFAFAIILIANIWRSIENLSAAWLAWRSKRKLTRSNNLTLRALLECVEGYYESAEKNANKALANAELPLVDYLIGAYCAHAQNKTETSEAFLLNAKNLMPESEVALQLLQIEWAITTKNFHEAQVRLEILLHDEPYQPRALFLAKDIYLQLGEWDKLLKITQVLRKRKIITPEIYESLQSKAYASKLINASKTHDIKTLNAEWLTIPNQYQQLPELILVYAKTLIELQHGSQAEELLRDSIKKYWDDELIYYYGLAVTENTENQLKFSEKFLTDHENDAVLLLTLGRLCARASLWAKARSYLEASAAIAAKPETYLLLAELTQGQGDVEKATDYYAKGLNLALRNT